MIIPASQPTVDFNDRAARYVDQLNEIVVRSERLGVHGLGAVILTGTDAVVEPGSFGHFVLLDEEQPVLLLTFSERGRASAAPAVASYQEQMDYVASLPTVLKAA